MKKSLSFISMVFAISLLFNACDSVTGVKMDTEKAVQLVDDYFTDEILAEGRKVYEIVWSGSEETALSNRARYLIGKYIDDEDIEFSRTVLLAGVGDGPQEPKQQLIQSKKYKYETLNGLTSDDMFSPEKVMAQFAEAKTYIPDGFSFKSIGEYETKVDAKTGNILRTFTLLVTDDSQKSYKEGNKIVTEYYEMVFDVDSDGSITYREE